MPAEFPLPPAQRTFINPAFRRNSLLSLSFGRSIDRDRFRSAWRTLLRVHPVLRTSFSPGTLVEHDFTGEDLPGWQEPDWSAQEPAGIPALWEELQERAAADFFKDGEFPLWRVYLIKLPEGQSHLLVAFHPGLIDRQSASTLLIQWLNASEAAEAVLDGLPVLPGLAMANASVDLGEPSGKLWPEDWRGDCALEALRPWFWLRPADPSPGHDSPLVAGRPVPASLIDAIHARAAQTGLSAQNVLSLLWAGFWAARSEFGGAFVAHPFDLSEHLAPEHREILGRLCPLAPLIVCGAPPIDRAWPEEWWSTHMESITRSGAHIFAQPPANLDDVILGVGLPDSDPYPGSVAVWSGESINDLLHTRLPRWLGADARWTEHPALPVNLFMQGGRHPEVSLVAHPAHIDQSTCRSLCEDFLILAARALSVSDPGLPFPAAGGKTSTDGSLFSLSSDPGLFEKLTDSLSDHADATILVMGESTMTGADLLGCSNQLARYLRRARLPDGTRYLVNLAPGNWLSLLLITLVREGMPFLLCDEIVTSERDPDWFEKEKIGCVFLDSTTGAGWEEREIKKIVLDSAWEKIAAMSDGALQLRKATGPVVWEFGSADGVQRVRLGEALLANFLSVSAEFWGMTSASRLLSTSVPGTPSWLEETLLACLSGATLVHAGQDIFATRSAFQEALQELQITHLGLPAIRWSDWVHFLVELRQPLPPALQRVMIRSGRMGAKAVSEWLRLSKDQVRSSVFVSPFGLTAPGLGMDLNENLLPLIGAGLIPLGFPLGGSEIHVLASDDRVLPSGAVGQLRLSLPANAVVDGVAASEKDLSLRGVMDASGLVCALSQPDVSSVGWTRPPVPVAAAAEATLLKRPEIFDAFVTRPLASGSSEGRQLQAWIIPQESGSSLPHGLAIWWKNEARFPWTLEAAAPIPKCPICKDGTLDTAALPSPSALAFKPSPTASQKTPSASTAAAPAPPDVPADWEIQWVEGQSSERKCSVVLCGAFPHANLADTLASGEAGAYAIGAAPVPRVGQLLKAQSGTVVCLAHGSDAWDFLRWINSLAPTDQERVRVLLVQPAIVENAPGIDTKLKSLWNKMLGRQTAGNSRREAGRGIRPVRCQISLRVLCSEEPETALITYLPEAEFFAGDLTSADTMAAAILDVLSEDAEEPEETQ